MSARVRQMFAAIAPRYDFANQVLSLGIHRAWRRIAVRESGVRPGQSVLDCATGTGDLAIAFKRAVGPAGRVVGTDFCAEMLALAPLKAKRASLDLDFELADATALPYPDASFHVSSIAFGIRNVDDPMQCLRELARVTRPAGRVVVLEFGQPWGVFGSLFRFYSRTLLPWAGGALTGQRSAYEYLPRTAAAFPCGERFLSMMRQASVFDELKVRPLTFGVAYVYVGRIPSHSIALRDEGADPL